jgi:hypothetical protein
MCWYFQLLMDLLTYSKKDSMDYSMIIFLGMTILIFGGAILHEVFTEKKND